MIQNIKGMPDILADETPIWRFVEDTLRSILETYAYEEIRTPIMEETSLFVRTVGETSDIVGKEMYSFIDQGETNITLRPEGTAPVMRAYLQHHLGQQSSFSKLYYIGPMFRRERPQKGRLRQFHQIGAEAIGSSDPWVDVEMIAVLMEICQRFKLPELRLEINSLGDAQTRTNFREVLKKYFQKHASKLSDGEKVRLEKNPLRLLDSKNPDLATIIQDAPNILEHLTPDSKKHFDQVLNGLNAAGIPYVVNNRIVRGLDYYCHTAFEIMAGNLGSQNSVGGGGRYDTLSKDLGDKEIPAIGFAMGLERVILSIEERLKTELTRKKRIEIIALDEKARELAFTTAQKLRSELNDKMTIDLQFDTKNMKKALQLADKNKADFVCIIGEDELKNKKLTIKDLHKREQESISADGIVKYVKEKL
jgi:histidyl-tRNA synthetase